MSANVRPIVVARVRRGMAVLDEQGPPNWRQLIDTKHLRIESLYDCVLGQLYGCYLEGMEHMPVSVMMDPYAYGFSVPESTTSYLRALLLRERIEESHQRALEWGELNKAWQEALTQEAQAA